MFLAYTQILNSLDPFQNLWSYILEHANFELLDDWVKFSFGKELNEDELQLLENKFKDKKIDQSMIDNAYNYFSKSNKNNFCNMISRYLSFYGVWNESEYNFILLLQIYLNWIFFCIFAFCLDIWPNWLTTKRLHIMN